MFKNYFKTAWRSLLKNKIFSLINVAGLAIGMAVCLLILQYVNFELSYDQFNKNAGDLYRVVNDRYQYGKRVQHGTITYSAIGQAMQNDFPEVVNHTRVMPYGKMILINGDKKIDVQNAIAIDNSFLSMFSYPMIAGDTRDGLKQPYNVILTKSTAGKLFDITNNDFNAIIGKTILMGSGSSPYKVTGVFGDVPENSQLKFDMLVSYTSLLAGDNAYKQADYDFTDSDFWHYIQLKHGTNYKELEAKLDAFSRRHFQGRKVSGSDEKFYLQPLSKAHLYSDFEYEIAATGSATVVWGLLAIAILIIVIAWVNYINLSTAKSMERAKEVGVRKVAGATKLQLIKQFLTESLLINLVSLCIAVCLVLLTQSSFNALVGHQLSISELFMRGMNNYTITIAMGLVIVFGMLASGFYPAFVLSSSRPILVLKGKFIKSARGILLRKGLVVGQFAVTIALIVGSIIIYQQIRFMNSQKLGMNIDQTLVVQPPSLLGFDSSFMVRENSFKEAIKKLSHIKNATTSGHVPGEELARAFNIHRADQDINDNLTMRNMGADADFIKTYNIKLLAGRSLDVADYSPYYKNLHNVMINESAVKLLGYKSNEDAVGKQIVMFGKTWDVVGVINNYHQKSLRFAVEPLIVQPFYSTNNPFSIKLSVDNLPSTLAQLKGKYQDFFPGNLFEYYFLDEKFNQQYANDKLFGKAFGIFAGFAILIACLGLFGLSLFSTTQRIKEIGVRKVLGASVPSILLLLSKDFVKLVFMALLIATPVAWYVMNNWLSDFAYRINISAWIFVGAGLASVLIALATISFQAMRAAMSKPVKSLRTE